MSIDYSQRVPEVIDIGLLEKKAYGRPVLTRFGTVAVLTQSTGSCTTSDGASVGTCPGGGGNMGMGTSDISVKQNIVRIGEHPLGVGLYLFDYKPEYRDAFGHGRQFGVMAQEVETIMPQAVVMHPDGYKMVDYAMLGISRAVH